MAQRAMAYIFFCLLFSSLFTQAQAAFTSRVQNLDSGKCMDVHAASQSDSANVVQWTCINNHPSQTITFTESLGQTNIFTLRFSHSNKCLDVDAGSLNDGGNLVQNTCNNSVSQEFAVIASGAGQYHLIPRHSARPATVANNALIDGANLLQWVPDASQWQQWMLLDSNIPAINTATYGQWSPVIPWPEIAISAATLPDGRILTWSSNETNRFPGSGPDFTHASVFDPDTVSFIDADNGFHDMFCAGVSLLEDGRIVASGGNPFDQRTSAFNFQDFQWSSLALMNFNRWYGTNLTLPSNEVFSTFAKSAGKATERYNPVLDTWTAVPGADMQDLLNEQNAENGEIAVNQASTLQWWGKMAVMPDGKIFHGGPTQTMHIYDATGSGSTQTLGQPLGQRTHMWGNTVTYDSGKTLMIGGHDRTLNPPTSSAVYSVNLNAATPEITAVASMTFPRSNQNAVTLPTGDVLVIGGNSSGKLFNDELSVHAPEIWHPATDTWSIMAGMDVPRNYHSIALLLKDGRVLSAGGGACGNCVANHMDGQIFTPPYLFNPDGTAATRPEIITAPLQISAGDSISVSASTDISSFSMIRLSATTHATNTDIRFLPVDFSANGNGQFNLNINPNPNVLIPGYYWLYAVNSNAVPSIGRTIQVLGSNNNTPLDTDHLNYEYYEGDWNALPVFNTLIPTRTGTISSFSLWPRLQDDFYAFRMRGYIDIPTTGSYTFSTTSDDGSQLLIDNNLLVNNDGIHAPVTQSASVSLTAGRHSIEVTFFEKTGGDSLLVQWSGPGIPLQTIAATALGGSDRDGDGVPNPEDAFPDDPSETTDSDGDGVGDNADAFPNDPTETTDSDGDGIGDNADPFPNDPTNNAAHHISSTTIISVQNTMQEEIWNVNPDNQSVTVADINGQKLFEIPVGNAPWSLTRAPTRNEIWVSNKDDATLSIIDTDSYSVVHTLSLESASQPHGIAFAADTTDLYVVLEASGKIIRIDALTRTVTASLDIGHRPRHLALSSDGNDIYVSRFITPPLPGEHTANIDLNSGGGEVLKIPATLSSVLSTITLGHLDRAISEITGPGIPNYLGAPVISPTGNLLYIPSKQDNISAGTLRGNPGLSFDQTVRAVTSIVNLNTGIEQINQRIDHDNAGMATSAIFSHLGDYLFVALETSREVAVLDLNGASELMRIQVGRAPQGLALSANGQQLLVHNFMDRTVGIFDISSIINNGLPAVTGMGTVNTVTNERLSPNVLTGKQFFYDAADTRLALDKYISCASCHNDGDDDGRTWDFTQFGEGLRNTISLEGKGSGHGMIHWSGNFDEIHDFENQIRNMPLGTGLMTDPDFLATQDPLGPPKAGLSANLDALTDYLASLNTMPANPHRQAGLSPAATQGQIRFTEKNCHSCHSGIAFTDSDTALRHDVGTISVGSGNRIGQPLDGLDTPTLLGIWNTAPFLHDGSAATIEAAILAHNIPVTAIEAVELASYIRELQQGDVVPEPGWTSLGSYRSSFAAIPQAGWSYLWNADSLIGNSDLYSPLQWNGNRFDSDGVDTSPDNTELRYGNLNATGGHTGLGVNQGAAADRFVIARYTVSNDASYRISASHITLSGCQFSNGLELRIYINNVLRKEVGLPVAGSSASFDTTLGNLGIGDRIDVVVGPNSKDGCDAFDWDYSIESNTGSGSTNQAPVINPPGAVTTDINTSVNLAINATDADGDTLSYSATGLPAGLTISNTSGIISGTPTTAGNSVVTITVSDGQDSSSTSFDWTVQDNSGVTLDTVITNPLANETLPVPVTIAGSATAPAGVDTVLAGIRDQVNNLWWNNGSWGSWVLNPSTVTTTSSTAANWTVSFDPTGTGGSGVYRIFARTRDLNGDLSSSITRNFNATENTNPGVVLEATITSPVSNESVVLPFTISGTGTAPAGVDTVLIGIRDKVNNLWWNNGSWGSWVLNPATVTATGNNSVNWNYSFNPAAGSGSGEYRIYARTRDSLGSLSTSAQVSFTGN